MIRCIYCGMCEEVCPEQAIFLRKDYAITGITRAEMVHDKKKLYEIGGVCDGAREQMEPGEDELTDVRRILFWLLSHSRCSSSASAVVAQPQSGGERAVPGR